MKVFINEQIAHSLRQLGIKPNATPDKIKPLLAAMRSFRSSLQRIAAASKEIGKQTAKPLAWCDTSQKVEDLYEAGKQPDEEIRQTFKDYLDACQGKTSARDKIEEILTAIDLKPTVSITTPSFAGESPFDDQAREVLGFTPKSISECTDHRGLYLIGNPVIDVDDALTKNLSLPQNRALGQIQGFGPGRKPADKRKYVPYKSFGEMLKALHSTQQNNAAALSMSREVGTRRPHDPRVASVIDLEDCLAAIAPRRLTGSIEQLVNDEEDLIRRRVAVDAAKAAYDKAVQDVEQQKQAEPEVLSDPLKRLACLLLDPSTALDGKATKPTTASAASGSGKLPTSTDTAGIIHKMGTADEFKTECKKLPSVFPKEGWLPALAQQYLAEAAINSINKGLSAVKTDGMKLDCAKVVTGTDAEKACRVVSVFDGISQKLRQQEGQEKELALAEVNATKQYYQVLLDQARKAVSRAEKIISFRNTQVSAAIDELEYLRNALNDLHLDDANLPQNACSQYPKVGDKSTIAICRSAWDVLGSHVKDLSVPVRVAVARSISHYLDSVTVGRVNYEIADMQINNMAYQQTVDDSQFALTAYDALISSPVTLLANYHASGITPSEVAQWLQILALAGIAVK